MNRPVSIAVVVGSTRPTRICADIANWVCESTQADSPLRYELLDLAEVGLPLLDEPLKASLQTYAHEHTRRWRGPSSFRRKSNARPWRVGSGGAGDHDPESLGSVAGRGHSGLVAHRSSLSRQSESVILFLPSAARSWFRGDKWAREVAGAVFFSTRTSRHRR